MALKDIWFISDTHFWHRNILTFTDDQGELIRPNFFDIEEMNERIIDNWNEHVKPGDKVYHLGDVTMSVAHDDLEATLGRLHGSKRLLIGNHDVDVKKLAPYFKKIGLWRIFKDEGFVCSHLPLMQTQFRYCDFNVHGHLHQNLMDEPCYINVCVEHTNYRPVHMDEIAEVIKEHRDG